MKIKLTKAKRSVTVHTPFIRMDDFLKLASAVSSGGQAKGAIQSGQVLYNGKVCTQRGKKLGNGDTAEYNGIVYEVVTE